MTLEKELISKTYYQTLINGNENGHPINVLGDMFMDEQHNEIPDLSPIRFAQGEVYFLNKDYEAAIFKWENISNELKPWAQKNIADAHYELDLLAIAEDYYKAVETESIVLKMEVHLQLFSLYIQLGKLDIADKTIKKVVHLNPDYSDVTDIARAFFEDYQDWGNAVELAVNEAIRTKSLSWFKVLERYVEQGHTVKMKPNYFRDVLNTLYHIDLARFESLSVALWNSYKQSDVYFHWLKEFNHLLLNVDEGKPYIWNRLSVLYNETYFGLINGKFLIREISHLIPNYLTNWLKISSTSDAIVSSSAVLAWSEIFPSQIDASLISQAENLLVQSNHYHIDMEEVLRLYEAITKWAKEEGMVLSERFEWMINELLDLDNNLLLITGSETSGKSAFVNMLLHEDLLEDSTSAVIVFKDADEADMHAITDEEVRTISNLDDFTKSSKSEKALIHCRMPISFLYENKITLIDTPGLLEQSNSKSQVWQHVDLADGILFVLNADSHLTGKELDMAVKLKEKAPELSFHFLLLTMDQITSNQETIELVENTASRINAYFPNAKVITISAYDGRESQLTELSSFTRNMMEGINLEEERTSKIMSYIKKSITFLIQKRVEMENAMLDNIKWDEEIVTKLKGAHHQLSDMEEEKVQLIKKSYSTIKDELREELMTKIPDLLRNCSDIIHEDSHFGTIHVEINDEMNKRMTHYMKETALPNFQVALQGWIAECEGEFKDSQAYLNEMGESFNHLYGEEKITLDCDWKVLDDWRRDVDRMTRGNSQVEKVNIMMRSTPSQLVLKTAGKLFGTLSKNNDILHNKYKQFIESSDYSQITKAMTDKFMQQFELFEQSLERDINMFFTSPFEVLNRTLEETHHDIEENKESLNTMRKNPEIYRDPLTLFELKLRQYEWMNSSGKEIYEYK